MQILQSDLFKKWFHRLSDRRAQVIVAARIQRVADGLLGDVKSVGDSVFELRIHYGPGYRVYFTQRGNEIIVLLVGGTKTSQAEDINKAKDIAKEYENV